MGRKVLLAWELGAGIGHILRLATIARALAARGFEPVYALQRLDTLRAALADTAGTGNFQAPIWPGLIGTRGIEHPTGQATLGDVLADLGLRDRNFLVSALSAWDTIFSHVQPSAVVSDYSPTCLLAARGRIPALVTGNGFTLPPAHLDRFPSLKPERMQPKYDEEALLEILNDALHSTARHPVDHLPAVFSAERTCVSAFKELDPYAAKRLTAYSAPSIPPLNPNFEWEADEIFVYLPEYIPSTIFTALENVAAAGKTIRLHAANLDQTVAGRLALAAIKVEREPLPLDSIVRRSRLIVSHGGLGTASSALVSGIPHVVIAFDMEKRLIGAMLEGIGVGRLVRIQRDNPLEAALLGQVILETYADDRLAETAKSLAPSFLARLQKNPAEGIADQLLEIATG